MEPLTIIFLLGIILTMALVVYFVERKVTKRCSAKPNQEQGRLSSEEVRAKYRAVFEDLEKELSAKLPQPKYKVGEEVQLHCIRENFRYAWENLASNCFKEGQDEEGIVTNVFVNSSYLEEVIMERFDRHLSLTNQEDALTKSHAYLLEVARKYINKLSSAYPHMLYYSCNLEFENPSLKVVTWGIDERLMIPRQVPQHA